MSKWIVVTGNPVNGFTFTGPFDDSDAAAEWAESLSGEDWWVAEIEPPPVADDWHINVYERDRAYGGPEEGGWWYDTGRYCPNMSVVLSGEEYTLERASLYADDLNDRLAREA